METRGRKPLLCPDPATLGQLIIGGYTLGELIEHFAVGPRPIHRWLRELGLELPERRQGNIYTSQHRLWQETSTQAKIDTVFTPERREVFWSKVVRGRDDECWPWSSSKTRHGYGSWGFQHRSYRAHRVAYMLAKGPVPADLHVLHSCDNRACCNPSHLAAGTVQQNNAQRDAQMKCTKGERHHSAKLKEWQVREIVGSSEPSKVLAKRYDVQTRNIEDIRSGRTWKNVTRAMRA